MENSSKTGCRARQGLDVSFTTLNTAAGKNEQKIKDICYI